jgi:hypothetical protein
MTTDRADDSRCRFHEFTISPDDPLAGEHAAVAAWVQDALATLREHEYYQEVDLRTLPSGKKLLEGGPEQSRRYVLAAVVQLRYWDERADEIRSRADNEIERMNPHRLLNWDLVWGRRRQAQAVVGQLTRRALPFQKGDLATVLRWCNERSELSTTLFPLGSISRACQRYASEVPLDADLRDELKRFARLLRSSNDKEAKRLGTTIEQLCIGTEGQLLPVSINNGGQSVPGQVTAVEFDCPPTPAPVGSTGVLDQLKRIRGMFPNASAIATTAIEPDRFDLPVVSPLRREHELLSTLFGEVVGTRQYAQPDFTTLKAGRALLGLAPDGMGIAILAAAERHISALLQRQVDLNEHAVWQSQHAASVIALRLLRSPFKLRREGLFDLILYLSVLPSRELATLKSVVDHVISQAQSEATSSPFTEGERYALFLLRAALVAGPPLGVPSEQVGVLARLINDGASFYLVPGEVWSDALNDDLIKEESTRKAPWSELIGHALTATSARPSSMWMKTAKKLLDAIGGSAARKGLERWLPLVAQGQSIRKLPSYPGDTRGSADVINEENATCLRGFLWMLPLLPGHDQLARLVSLVALSAYRKVPGVGPRAVKVGNAAVYVLSQMGTTDAVGQLAMLKVRVRFGTAQKEIEKAFVSAALALALPRDQIEEMGVPSYGLDDVGLRRETLGDHRAELTVSGSGAELLWFDANGKNLKSVPARVKSDHGDDLKDLQQALKDIQAMLPAQCDRIDSMFLLHKTWPIEEWRERYLDHPLVGTIARRLVWRVDGTACLFVDGQPTDLHGAPHSLGASAEVMLWHPIGSSIAEVTAWRRVLEERGVTQPFKQAHREVYLLTDAERNTRTYSNRFAAHILRQHQFNALCAARGWKNKLRLMVDDEYPPASKDMPDWGLRAEFWVEGVGDQYGTDTNESGVYLRLSTDQVRFYRRESAQNVAHAAGGGYATARDARRRDDEPIALEEIPPLVLSEIMRDVDLFVGVASVGNDPTWQDGGPQGQYRDYWQHYSFGALSESAATRKQVLERLIPRLKIARQCSFVDRFLVVRGQKRTYKIHLGSANILMEPNDQYLCIVPDSRTRSTKDDLFLPFEGDSTLSVIISKALLLAEDTKIKDPTIVRQIDGA